MPFLLIVIGSLLLISAVRNTYGDMATALETDIPPYFKWALAIVATGSLGWIPGMREISRWLLGLVIVVIVLKNYQAMLTGFVALEQTPTASQAAATPGSVIAASSGAPITQGQITGTSGTATNISTAPTGNPIADFLNSLTNKVQSVGGAIGGQSSNAVPGSINAAGIPPATPTATGTLNPASYLTAFETGVEPGFGGIA